MIAVVNYGMGNLHSVAKALETAGGDVSVTDNPSTILSAERIVLPGVGAFGKGMANLRRLNLLGSLQTAVIENRIPFLGICLGMQIISSSSREKGTHEGLGWIDAEVVPFPTTEGTQKIPHTGWNVVERTRDSSVLSGVGNNPKFYFVHSMFVTPQHDSVVAAQSHHICSFTSAIERNNIFATQFHPEKSQDAGIQLLRNFLVWEPNEEN